MAIRINQEKEKCNDLTCLFDVDCLLLINGSYLQNTANGKKDIDQVNENNKKNYYQNIRVIFNEKNFLEIKYEDINITIACGDNEEGITDYDDKNT